MTDGVDQMVRNRHLVEDLGGALRSGKHGLSTVPALLKRVLAEESWREFTTQRGEYVRHERFTEFVVTPPLKGIGASVDLLRRVIVDDAEALDLLDQALQRPTGGSNKISLNVDNIDNETDLERPRGTSKDYALRKLRKDAPELHARVLAGELSPHAAMVEAGFRPPSFTIRATDPDTVVATLRRRLPAEWLADVAARLAS